MKFHTRLRPSSTLVDLTPLVDVVFLLLIFFMISADIMPLKSLSIEQPTLQTNSPSVPSELLVAMDAQHVIYLGSHKEIVDPTTLRERLTEEVRIHREKRPDHEPTIVLSVDKRVEYGAFLTVFVAVQDCGSKVRLVYKPLADAEA